ncbi:MAG TPA: rhomboid family intramembrane serine protease [Verrucomicrobiae bacterium]|jgi:membrane associated rhomboid family serine protease|nr:rhomboid family intramembrane serine protease [Verrucomicrobiae bacterium]
MEPAPAKISARSKRQVMDWGLVLASQGIEAILNHSESGWELIVEARDFERAEEVIRQYQIENRGWRWKQPLPGSGLVFHWGSLGWVAAIGAVYYWSMVLRPGVRSAGVLDSVRAKQGEWWRLFTAVSLHENMAHLVSNAATGFVLLGLAMARFGAGPALLAAFLAGVVGNAADLLIYTEPHDTLGASGMVTGALGLITSQSFAFWRKYLTGRRFLLQAAAGGILILVLIGFDPNADVVAHIGGFLAGGILGFALGHARAVTLQRGWVNVASLAALAALFLTTWRLALRAP